MKLTRKLPWLEKSAGRGRKKVIRLFTDAGEQVKAVSSDVLMPDEDDRVFYEVTLSKKGAQLVTGNLKHFPKANFILTPSEFIQLLQGT